MEGKKGPLILDWDKLMPRDKDDDPPPELLIATDTNPSPPPPESRQFAGMSDAAIEKQINNHKNLLKLNLKDNGKKILAKLKLLEEEKERRLLFPVNNDSREKQMQSKKRDFTSTSADFVETTSTPPQASHSEFGAHLIRKMDENRTESRQVNAFESELNHFWHGGNRNARFTRQNSSRGQQNSMMSLKQSPFRCPTKVTLDAKQRNISDGDQYQHCSTRLSQKCKEISPDTFMKKRRPSPSLASKDPRPRNGSAYVLLDEDEPEHEPELVECMEQAKEVDEWFDESMKDCSIYYPSREDPESVEISYSDMQCLAPQTYLSSTIMNFYIRHLQQPALATERRSNDYHFFNTYFYNKLTEAISKNENGTFLKFRRWWKGVDIFQKAYILLPIHESLHWSLVIICIPDKEEDSGPIILHLDSLGLHSSNSIFYNVKRFLREEWNCLHEGEAPCRIEDKRIEVPQQKNDYDCGLFVLYFIERFIVEAPQRLKRDDLAMFGSKWFKHEDASNLRPKIKKLLMEEFKKATQDNCVPDESTTLAVQEQKFDQSVDISKFILVEPDQMYFNPRGVFIQFFLSSHKAGIIDS